MNPIRAARSSSARRADDPARDSAPTSEVGRVKLVFELELARGCDNQAVIGGIDRLIVQLAEDGHLERLGGLSRRARLLPPGGYRSMNLSLREQWLQGTIAVMRPQVAAAESVPVSAMPESGPRVVAPRAPGFGRDGAPLDLDSPVTRLPGIGKSAAERFSKLGVTSAGDAVMHFPRRFNDFTDVRRIADLRPAGTPVTVVGKILSAEAVRFGRRIRGTEALITDGAGTLKVVWFNMPYVAKALAGEEAIVVSGKVRLYRGRLQMDNPDYEPFDSELMHTGRLVPVYPATAGLSQRAIRRAVKEAVERLADRVVDPIPARIRDAERLSPLATAVRSLHYPATLAEAEEARRRIATGEFLAVQCAVLMRRAEWQRGAVAPSLSMGDIGAAFRASLPFPLTGAQERAIGDILADIRGPQPMLRLLQGDVGSGKTVVAFAALVAAVRSGLQAALMAPTEILAEQHYRSLSLLLGGSETGVLEGVFAPPWFPRPLRMLLLTGSLTPAQKEQVRADAAHGGCNIVIGTHALLEGDVVLPELGLVVIDEQHRFGVMQRARLRQKGRNPHLLVMTATPIPRTLALTVYGDLEVSTVDELPPGRRPVKTDWVQPHERDEAYAFIRERLDAGQQAFVICPLIEESEALDLRSAEEEFERLQRGPFRQYRLELLHGRMPGRMKEEVMGRFGRGQSHMLVSTSVIEVGIDIPNATVMVIEGAERFGLSQLHQFRGRVGRSAAQSYCLLFSTNEDPGPEARDRLEAMVATTDGFRLAEIDLELRGEGEAWGTVQSGVNAMLRVARLTDRDLLLHARGLARRILDRDPMLQLAEHRPLATAVGPFLAKATEAN